MGHWRAWVELHTLDVAIPDGGVKQVKHRAQIELVATADVNGVAAFHLMSQVHTSHEGAVCADR